MYIYDKEKSEVPFSILITSLSTDYAAIITNRSLFLETINFFNFQP